MVMETEFKQARVHWYDSAYHAGWKNRDELETIVAAPCMLMETFGWLVADTDDHVVIAQTVSGTQADGILQIPKGAIIELRLNFARDDSDE